MSNFLEDIEFASKVNKTIKEVEQRSIENNIKLTKEMIKQQYDDIEQLQQTKDNLQKDYQEAVDKITELQQENKQLKEEKRKVRDYIHKMQQNFKQEEHIGTAYDDDIFYDDILEILGDKE